MRAILIALLLSGCAATQENQQPATPTPAAEVPDRESVLRLIGETVSIERFRADLIVLRKAKSLTALQYKELSALVTLADDAAQHARGALLSGDRPGFQRAMQVSSDILQEVRGLISIYEAEKRRSK